MGIIKRAKAIAKRERKKSAKRRIRETVNLAVPAVPIFRGTVKGVQATGLKRASQLKDPKFAAAVGAAGGTGFLYGIGQAAVAKGRAAFDVAQVIPGGKQAAAVVKPATAGVAGVAAPIVVARYAPGAAAQGALKAAASHPIETAAIVGTPTAAIVAVKKAKAQGVSLPSVPHARPDAAEASGVAGVLRQPAEPSGAVASRPRQPRRAKAPRRRAKPHRDRRGGSTRSRSRRRAAPVQQQRARRKRDGGRRRKRRSGTRRRRRSRRQ